MRLWGVLILSAICICVSGSEGRKFNYLAGYTNVEILGVDHRGIQIMHKTGLCHLRVEDLSDNDRKLLEKEVEEVAVKQKQYKERQAVLKKQKAAFDKKSKAELKKQTDAQNKEINDLVKKFAKKNIYDILRTLEAQFGLTKNSRNMGLKGRVKSVVNHIERKWPLAKKYKQSFQPKMVKTFKIETKPGKGKDDKKIKVKTSIVLAKAEAPVMMNALSKSIVEKRLALEAKVLSKAAAKLKAAEEKAKGEDGGGDAGGGDAGGGDAGGGDAGGEAGGEAGGDGGEAGGDDGGAE